MAERTRRGSGWLVDSPAVGAGLRPQPCGDELRPADPSHCDDPFAVTLSGGGFRATLAGLGVLRFVADIGRLNHLRYCSSVSGGRLLTQSPPSRGQNSVAAATPRRPSTNSSSTR